MVKFILNKKPVEVDVEHDMPLLWVLRDIIKLTGTKYGCGIAQCGACTVQLDGQAIRACVFPVGQAQGKRITTIEGIDDDVGKRLKQAWLQVDVPQCGYCQSGQLMTAHALLQENANPTRQEIVDAMHGNICRCGTYPRILEAMLIATKGVG